MCEITNLAIVDSGVKDLSELYGSVLGKEEDIIFTMIYKYVEGLPFSMDINQPEYIPADFLHMSPLNREDSKFFKWEDSKTVFTKFAGWGDTRRSALIVQTCALFQKMLQGEFPHDYILPSFEEWELSGMNLTQSRDYNMKFFEILKGLPDYYNMMQDAKDDLERRDILKDLYSKIQLYLANRLGNFTEHDENGNIKRFHAGNIICSPFMDLKMLYSFNYIKTLSDYRVNDFIEEVRNVILNNVNRNKIIAEDNFKNFIDGEILEIKK